MRNLLSVFVLCFLLLSKSFSQNNVGIGTKSPNSKAILELSGTDQGFLVPRMDSLGMIKIYPNQSVNPDGQGMLVYDTLKQNFWYFDGNDWILAIGPEGPIGPTGPTGLSNIDSLILQYASFDTLLATFATFDSVFASMATFDTLYTSIAYFDSIFATYGSFDSLYVGGVNINSFIDSMILASSTMGATGPTGPTGADGSNGTNGVDGATGVTGPTGPSGTNGANGAQGVTGATGADGSANAWGLTGNAGTTAGTNFLGTTDSKDLVIKTNGTERVRVNTSGNVGIGSSSPSQKIDVSGNMKFSGALMPNGDAGTSGYVLISQGSGNPPVWQSVSAITQAITLISSATVTASYPSSSTITYKSLTGLKQSITVPTSGTYTVMCTAMGTAEKASSTGTRVFAQYAYFVDGTQTGGIQRVSIDDEESSQYARPAWAISSTFTLTAGTHSIEVKGAHAGGDCTSSSCASIDLCTPDGYVGQASLNILIIKE
jgi:hypothetical protein